MSLLVDEHDNSLADTEESGVPKEESMMVISSKIE